MGNEQRFLNFSRVGAGLLVLAVAAATGDEPRPCTVQTNAAQSSVLQLADISGDAAKPRRHFRVSDAVNLPPAKALQFYRKIQQLMRAGYNLSGHRVARDYPAWERFNRAPFRSATHGRRYVNNYANAIARDYGQLQDGQEMPVGSIIAKDSFSVTEKGGVHPGPLFIMEKMPSGFNYVSGDWRYTMIMPDGSVFGVTKGDKAQSVEFCIACHLAMEHRDHLYFVPEEYRLP